MSTEFLMADTTFNADGRLGPGNRLCAAWENQRSGLEKGSAEATKPVTERAVGPFRAQKAGLWAEKIHQIALPGPLASSARIQV